MGRKREKEREEYVRRNIERVEKTDERDVGSDGDLAERRNRRR